MSIIEPTPGRVVWYRPGITDPLRGDADDAFRPLAAHIAWVNSPTSVNLMVIDRSGKPHPRVHVRLLQEGDSFVSKESCCEWMPYQKGQAAKTEQLQAQLAEPAVLNDGTAAPTA